MSTDLRGYSQRLPPNDCQSQCRQTGRCSREVLSTINELRSERDRNAQCDFFELRDANSRAQLLSAQTPFKCSSFLVQCQDFERARAKCVSLASFLVNTGSAAHVARARADFIAPDLALACDQISFFSRADGGESDRPRTPVRSGTRTARSRDRKPAARKSKCARARPRPIRLPAGFLAPRSSRASDAIAAAPAGSP